MEEGSEVMGSAQMEVIVALNGDGVGQVLNIAVLMTPHLHQVRLRVLQRPRHLK